MSPFGNTGDQWELVRSEIVARIIKEHAIKDFEVELRQRLSEGAQKMVIQKCAYELSNIINIRPYIPDKKFTVISCANNQHEAAFLAIDVDGIVLDYIIVSNIL